MKSEELKTLQNSVLEQLYLDFDIHARLSEDPIEFPWRYDKPAEREIAGFLSATLAFGRINLFKPVIEKLLNLGKGSLLSFVMDFQPARDRSLLSGIYYRIWTEDDLAGLIYAIKTVLIRYGSLEKLFMKNYNPALPDLEEAMIAFATAFYDFNPGDIFPSGKISRGFRYFVTSPKNRSACKRLCLFLRWMVRKGAPDFGLWKGIEPSKLIIPLDVHLFRVSRFMKLTRYKTAGWKSAMEITARLRELEPDDPLKFDFPLCHFSISEQCPVAQPFPKNGNVCRVCSIRGKCYFLRTGKTGTEKPLKALSPAQE